MKIKKTKGFSLIELMISLSITITIVGLLVNFLFDFNKKSTISNKKSELSTELRNVNSRLQKEIQSCSKVLNNYTVPSSYDSGTPTIYSDNNRIILTRAVYDKNTYLPATLNPSDTTKNDVVIIEYKKDSNPVSVKYSKILYSLIPASGTSSNPSMTKSPLIIKTTLARNVINSSKPDSFTSFDAFRYFDENNSDSSSSKINTSMVEVNIYGKIAYGDVTITDSLITRININNYSN